MNVATICFVLIGLMVAVCVNAAVREFVRPTKGMASFYDWHFAGKLTASGERFNPSAMTCATQSRKIPFGTVLLVTNIDNGRRVVVRVNDRMGKHDPADRIIDLSSGAFKIIEDPRKGVCRVSIEIIKVK